MTSAYILVAAILLVGAIVAALGDRVGTKVGKARLRLFNLRPRQTATVVTVFTGTLIAALTFGIIFALSESLRQGVFELDDILKQRRQIKRELAAVSQAKQDVERQLQQTIAQQAQIEQNLIESQQQYHAAKQELNDISEATQILTRELKTLIAERQQLTQQRQKLTQQLQQQDQQLTQQQNRIGTLNQTLESRKIRLQELQNQQQQLLSQIQQQDRKITKLDRVIASKDEFIQDKQAQLDTLAAQIRFLRQEVTNLERYYQDYQDLRARRIALVKGQVLAFGAFRVIKPEAAIEVVDELLRRANSNAIEATSLGQKQPNYRAIQITNAQVQQLVEQIQSGEEYVVRIISANNYVIGEENIRVFTDITPNKKIFEQGQEIATVSIDQPDLTEDQIKQRLDLLIAASEFRARSSGVLGEIQIEEGKITTIINFFQNLNQAGLDFEEIKTVAIESAYTAGPLKLKLVAIKNGQIVFST